VNFGGAHGVSKDKLATILDTTGIDVLGTFRLYGLNGVEVAGNTVTSADFYFA
jgi:hypothetical protein